MPQMKDSNDLKAAVERSHSCSADFVYEIAVIEQHDGQVVWEGMTTKPQSETSYSQLLGHQARAAPTGVIPPW